MSVPAVEQTAVPAFESLVADHKLLHTYDKLDIMQVNVGRLCNLSCKHCHMEAGPQRTEIIDKPVLEACLTVLQQNGFATVDITGGAPEMNPHFRWFAQAARALCNRVIVRTNLVILTEPGYDDLPAFFKKLGLEVVCSLPHYTAHTTDRVRGGDTFARSIKALQKLNSLGYGIEEGLPLNLVFNPGGAFLAPEQTALERDFRKNLSLDYGLKFNNLLAITNNPVGRFGEFLARSGNLEDYMGKLYAAFNACTLEAMMCRNQISVGYDGALYDCDFNQAANLPIAGQESIFDWIDKPVSARRICFGKHCYACTAGQGSSCGGATQSA